MTAVPGGADVPEPHPSEINKTQLPVSSAQHVPGDAIFIFVFV